MPKKSVTYSFVPGTKANKNMLKIIKIVIRQIKNEELIQYHSPRPSRAFKGGYDGMYIKDECKKYLFWIGFYHKDLKNIYFEFSSGYAKSFPLRIFKKEFEFDDVPYLSCNLEQTRFFYKSREEQVQEIHDFLKEYLYKSYIAVANYYLEKIGKAKDENQMLERSNQFLNFVLSTNLSPQLLEEN